MHRIILLLAILSITLSCEDTKNKNVSTTESATKSTNISEKNKNEKAEKKDVSFPKITNENIVEFLTEYGNNNSETQVKIITTHGDIFIELYQDTPLHRANFIYLVKQGYFNNTFFHRVVPNFIIQGGNSDNSDTNKKRYKIGDKYLIPAEIKGRNHTYGSISGAKEYRENPGKQTAPCEFFIFLGPQTSTSHLNGNYTVFAKVTKGMSVVEKIANLPAEDDEWPKQNVKITAEIIQ